MMTTAKVFENGRSQAVRLPKEYRFDVIKQKPQEVIHRFLLHDPGELCVSSVTYGELMLGVEKSQAVQRNRAALAMFLSSLTVLDFDAKAAESYGKIRADLKRQGVPIGPMDMLIAAHALSRGLIIVTNNEGEFRRIKGLPVENWAV